MTPFNLKFWTFTLPSLLASVIAHSAKAETAKVDSNAAAITPAESETIISLAEYLSDNQLVSVSNEGRIKIKKSLFEKLKEKNATSRSIVTEGTHSIGGGCKSN